MSGHTPWRELRHKDGVSQSRDTASPLPAAARGGVLLEAAHAEPERKRRKKKLPKVISAEEAERLLTSIEQDDRVPNTVALRNRLMVELMYRAGLRVSEVVALKPRDVEADGVIHIYDAKGGDGTAYFPAEELAPQLEAWLAIRASWASFSASPLHPLFIKPSGDPVGVRYLQRLVKRHKEALGIAGIVTPHVFRHTFATQLLEEGFSLTEVQSSLRHQNLATTAVYLHVRDEALRRKMTRRPRRQREEV